jgi:predicted NBD/HSP70 family sugar kinase
MRLSEKSGHTNTARVLRMIWLSRGISRTELARALRLDKSTVTNIVSQLIDIGIVQGTEEGKAGPLGGRKPIRLDINRSYGCVAGFEIRPDSYTATAVDLDGKILFSETASLSASGNNLASVFLDLLDHISTKTTASGMRLIGAGVGVSGIVNPYSGVIYQSIPLDIREPFDFSRAAAASLDLPVRVENDANCCCWGELAFHKRARLQDFLFALVEFRDRRRPRVPFGGVAVGLGVVIGGRVHYGRDFSAGEFRSVYSPPGGSGQFTLTEAEMLRVQENAGLFRYFLHELAANLALLVNTLNLSHVFIGGAIERYGKKVIPVLRQAIRDNWAYPNEVRCTISFSSHGENAVAYGAAGMLLERVFSQAVPGRISGTEQDGLGLWTLIGTHAS